MKLKERAKNMMRRQRVAISVSDVNVAALMALNLGDAEKSSVKQGSIDHSK